jgi:kynurenine formamidase
MRKEMKRKEKLGERKNVEQEKAKQIVIRTEWQKEIGNQKFFEKMTKIIYINYIYNYI